MCTPMSVVLLTCSMHELLLRRVWWAVWAFLKSILISFVLSTLREVVSSHQSASRSTWPLYHVSPSLSKRPTRVVLFASFMKRLESHLAKQSWVIRENSSGLSSHPWVALVLSVVAAQVMFTPLLRNKAVAMCCLKFTDGATCKKTTLDCSKRCYGQPKS